MQELHKAVREKLCDIAGEFASCGLNVFVFGSIAENWPYSPVGADLDIGFEGDGDQAVRERLSRAIDALPTIRPVDLVDFDKVDEHFKSIALQHKVDLLNDQEK